MSLSGLWLCCGILACGQLYSQAARKRTQVEKYATLVEKDGIWEDGCCKYGCRRGLARNAEPFCASHFTFLLWDVVHEGLQTQELDDSVCARVEQGEACDTRRLAETKFGFNTGESVRWIKSDADVPAGAVGTVVGFTEDRGGDVEVRFPKGTWNFLPTQLVKTPASETALVPADVKPAAELNTITSREGRYDCKEWYQAMPLMLMGKAAYKEAHPDPCIRFGSLGTALGIGPDPFACCKGHCIFKHAGCPTVGEPKAAITLEHYKEKLSVVLPTAEDTRAHQQKFQRVRAQLMKEIVDNNTQPLWRSSTEEAAYWSNLWFHHLVEDGNETENLRLWPGGEAA